MNRINNYVLNGAIALLSTAGLVACSSSDDVTDAPVNPTYDGKSVKTQFAINIATPSNGKTRMSAENTQNDGNYKGMAHVRLLTYTLTSNSMDASSVPGTVLKLADPTDVKYDNGTLHSSHIYSDVNIPVGTDNFLFYSTRKFESGSKVEETGAISSNIFNSDDANTAAPTVTNNAAIQFTAVKILNDNNTINDQTTAFAKYLNDVLEAKDGTDIWANIGTSQEDNNDSQDKKTLRKAYQNFTAKYTDAQRAGSANAVRLQMQDLYNVVVGLKAPASESNPTPEQKVAAAICTAILNESGTNIKFIYQEDDSDPDTPKGTLSYASGLDEKYTKFPCEQGLPEGAALLTYDSTNGFSYVEDGKIGNTASGSKTYVGVKEVTYPLPIVYFCNTPVKASNTEIAKSDWQTSTSTWDSWDKWSSWDNKVMLTTRSIALRNNINYGVAGLVTTVKCAKKQLEDNKAAIINNESNQIITIPTDGFQVTGLIIGGQPSKVNWQFVDDFTSASGSGDRPNVVYDKVTNNALASTSKSSNIYTLVFDNWKSISENETQETVNVAIELENGETEFYGQDGIIAAGQKFYLIGQLNPASATNLSSFAWPGYGTGEKLPDSYKGRYPVKAGSSTETGNNRVFIQDYTTTANFTINSLKNAYVTIPDLRATKLQLGLSVDLDWQSGLTFNVPID